jgi:hypothetical protein
MLDAFDCPVQNMALHRLKGNVRVGLLSACFTFRPRSLPLSAAQHTISLSSVLAPEAKRNRKFFFGIAQLARNCWSSKTATSAVSRIYGLLQFCVCLFVIVLEEQNEDKLSQQ